MFRLYASMSIFLSYRVHLVHTEIFSFVKHSIIDLTLSFLCKNPI